MSADLELNLSRFEESQDLLTVSSSDIEFGEDALEVRSVTNLDVDGE